MLNCTIPSWEHPQIQNIIDFGNNHLQRSINIIAKQKSQKPLDQNERDVFNIIVDSFLNARFSKGLEKNRFGNNWAMTATQNTFAPDEVKEMITDKNKLISKLNMAHQRFLNSKFAMDLKNNSNPLLPLTDLQKEIAKSKTPISVTVAEGRKE